MKKGNKGFTLIELLVVIAIIAILSTVVMAGLNSARSKARDARRLSDVKQLQSALELYFDSCNGYPGDPIPVTGIIVNSSSAFATASYGGCATHVNAFMNPLPSNPTPSGTDYKYYPATVAGVKTAMPAGTNAPSYLIEFMLENNSGSLGSGTRTASPSGIQ